MFTSNHTGRDSDTMLPLYMQDKMYLKSLLLDTEASMGRKLGVWPRDGDGRELNKLWLPVLSIFT